MMTRRSKKEERKKAIFSGKERNRDQQIDGIKRQYFQRGGERMMNIDQVRVIRRRLFQ